MNIAIVYPEVYDLARFREGRKEFPPFGPLYLAAAAETAGHIVTVHKVSPRETALDLREADVVAFSVSSSATFGLLEKARFGSLLNPNALLLAGGVHANFYPEQTLNDLAVEAVGVGEGEETFLELISHAKDRDLSAVPGVCTRISGRIERTSLRPWSKEIDWLPHPARHLLAPDDFVMTDRLAETDMKMAHVMFSRGCPFPCRFCAAAKQRMQYRSGASARAELISLIEGYGIEGFAIVDDNFIVNKRRVIDMCREIRDLGLAWSALSRVDTVDDELLAEMRASGCLELKFGIESGSERLLRAMDKNISQDHIFEAVNGARRAGIGVKAFLIHGFPGENLETTSETISLLDRLKLNIQRVSLFRFVPLPGTFVYRNAEQFGIRGTHLSAGWDGDWSRFHIHHNSQHWWGTDRDFEEVESSYQLLKSFVDGSWPDRHSSDNGSREAA